MSTLKTADGLELHLHRFGPTEGQILVALLHGYGEHAGRYAHVGRAWAEHGIRTLAVDLRGHGRSSGVRGYVERFDDYHLDATALVDEARAEANGRPIFLFGHSMGGLIALHWLLSGGGKDLAGLALSSPLCAVKADVPAWKTKLGTAMSRVYPKLSLPSGLVGRDVSRDPEQARIYDSDPLNNKNATSRWYTETVAAMARVGERARELQLPTILLYGGDDRVASADATDRLAATLAMSDQTKERLPGYYHELVNEPEADRDRVIARYAAWFLAHKG